MNTINKHRTDDQLTKTFLTAKTVYPLKKYDHKACLILYLIHNVGLQFMPCLYNTDICNKTPTAA